MGFGKSAAYARRREKAHQERLDRIRATENILVRNINTEKRMHPKDVAFELGVSEGTAGRYIREAKKQLKAGDYPSPVIPYPTTSEIILATQKQRNIFTRHPYITTILIISFLFTFYGPSQQKTSVEQPYQTNAVIIPSNEGIPESSYEINQKTSNLESSIQPPATTKEKDVPPEPSPTPQNITNESSDNTNTSNPSLFPGLIPEKINIATVTGGGVGGERVRLLNEEGIEFIGVNYVPSVKEGFDGILLGTDAQDPDTVKSYLEHGKTVILTVGAPYYLMGESRDLTPMYDWFGADYYSNYGTQASFPENENFTGEIIARWPDNTIHSFKHEYAGGKMFYFSEMSIDQQLIIDGIKWAVRKL